MRQATTDTGKPGQRENGPDGLAPAEEHVEAIRETIINKTPEAAAEVQRLNYPSSG